MFRSKGGFTVNELPTTTEPGKGLELRASSNFVKKAEPQEPVSVYTVSSATLIPVGNTLQDEPYDPHLHRQVDHPTSNFETWVHMIKGSLGTGILAMPNAFHNAGLLVGAIFTIIIGSTCTYCLHILIRSQYMLCSRARVPILSYPDTLRMALEKGPVCLRRAAPYSPLLVDIFLVIYQLGICCVYIVFTATNIKEAGDAWFHPIALEWYMLMLLVPLILINWVRNLKYLAPLSTLANLITFIGLGIIMYYVFDDLPPLSDRPLAATFATFPLFIGTTLFSLEAVGVVIALENNMKTPRSFQGYTGVLNRAMVVIVSFYVFVGFFGYVRYGSDAKGSITLNLPPNEVLAQCVKVMFAVAIFITYALQCYVPLDIIWMQRLKPRLEKSNHVLLWEYATRTAIVCSTFILAVAVPRLELFISLFGALCLAALGLVFPAIIELCVLWPNMGKYNWILVKDLALFTFGFVGMCIGTFVSLRDIVLSFL